MGTIDVWLDPYILNRSYRLFDVYWLFERLGMVLLELSALIFIDNLWGDKIKGNSLFLKIGQKIVKMAKIFCRLRERFKKTISQKIDKNRPNWTKGPNENS